MMMMMMMKSQRRFGELLMTNVNMIHSHVWHIGQNEIHILITFYKNYLFISPGNVTENSDLNKFVTPGLVATVA